MEGGAPINTRPGDTFRQSLLEDTDVVLGSSRKIKYHKGLFWKVRARKAQTNLASPSPLRCCLIAAWHSSRRQIDIFINLHLGWKDFFHTCLTIQEASYDGTPLAAGAEDLPKHSDVIRLQSQALR